MLTTAQLSELKLTTPAFRSNPPELEAFLVRHGTYLNVPAGTRLFTEGDPCHALLLITRGSVRVVKPSEDGREILLYRVNPGEFCVLTVGCLTANKPYPSDGVCDTAVSGIRVPAECFDRLSQEHPAFGRYLLDLMGARLAGIMDLVEAVAFHRLDRRVARLLIEKTNGDSNDGGPLEVTHSELARDLGSSREIVSRVLGSFEADGLVKLGRKRIEILEAERLHQISTPRS